MSDTDKEFIETINKSVELEINPLEVIIETFQLQKEYKLDNHYYCNTNGEPTEYSDDVIKQYVIDGLDKWYNMRCTK